MKKIIIKKTHALAKDQADLNLLRSDPDKYLKSITNDEIGKLLEYLSDHYYNKTPLVSDYIYDYIR
jgi:hypothetical protein